MNASSKNPVTWLGLLGDVASGLSQRSHYSDERALEIARDISHLHAGLQDAFRSWWESGGIPEQPEIHGHTARSLIEQGRCRSIPVAFTWLDALMKRPQETIARIHATYDIISANPASVLGVCNCTLQ